MQPIHPALGSQDALDLPSHHPIKTVADTYSLGSVGTSRPPASALRALNNRSNCSSNLALSLSHPVKSAAKRDLICRPLPLFHLSLNRYPSRFNGISARTFLPRSFIMFRSFSKAVSISLSTHQLLRELSEQHSRTLSHRRMPRSTCSYTSSPGSI